jgi:hypothetical protein
LGSEQGDGTQIVNREGALTVKTNRPQNNVILRIASILFVCVLFADTATAANSLSLVRTSASSISVRLDNSDSVAGLQFTVSGSVGIMLSSLDRGDRIASDGWLVDWNRVSDSTINVVVLAPASGSLPAGSGVVAEIFLAETSAASEVDYLNLKNVVAVDQNAGYVAITAQGLI